MELADITRKYAELKARRGRMRDALAERGFHRSTGPFHLQSALPEGRLPSRWEAGLEQAADDPERFALKAAAREIGWRVFAEGGLGAMRELFDAAEAAGANGAVLDKWWDGIGRGVRSGPGWCV